MKLRITIIFTILFIRSAFSTTWLVGPSQTYTMPSQVSSLVQNGDTVYIDAGLYSGDVAHWTADSLVLQGVNGFVQLFSGGLTFGDKAIWVISGDDNIVENIEFSQATSTSNNGAGIRQEGHNLTVRHCKFHHNEDGILAGTMNPSKIVVEFSEFGYNGFGDGFTHNIYINNIDTFIFRFNYSHHAVVGHEVKSRAHFNNISYNRISDEDSSDASRSIDLPNGGLTFIIGNVIEQGPFSQNSNIIGYGLEGLSNPSPHEVYAINNTIVNDKTNGSFFQFDNGTSLFKGYNNILAGQGNFVTGNWPSNVDTISNIVNTNISSFSFFNTTNYDYHLTSGSSAIDFGSIPGSVYSISLLPEFEYEHFSDSVFRCISGNIDVGAHEYCAPVSVGENSLNQIKLFPIPTNDQIRIEGLEMENARIEIINSVGKFVLLLTNTIPTVITTVNLTPGIYFVRITAKDLVHTVKIQIIR